MRLRISRWSPRRVPAPSGDTGAIWDVMESATLPVTIYDPGTITESTGLHQNSNQRHTDMVKRTADEDINMAILTEIREMRMAFQKNQGGWIRPAIQGLGAALGALIVVFGIQYVPKSQSDSDRRVDNIETRVKQVEQLTDQIERVKAKYENMRTLYLIRFGEDPDQVSPETMKRRR